MPDEMKDLGCANGWGKDPQEVIKCRADNHKHLKQVEEMGRCLTRVTCPICRYAYTYDSSD